MLNIRKDTLSSAGLDFTGEVLGDSEESSQNIM